MRPVAYWLLLLLLAGARADDCVDVNDRCDDNDPCTTNDVFVAPGQCRGTPILCNLDVPVLCRVAQCVDGDCVEANAPDGTFCSDGLIYTNQECQSGECVVTSEICTVPSDPCVDSVTRTEDGCQLTYKAPGTVCGTAGESSDPCRLPTCAPNKAAPLPPYFPVGPVIECYYGEGDNNLDDAIMVPTTGGACQQDTGVTCYNSCSNGECLGSPTPSPC